MRRKNFYKYYSPFFIGGGIVAIVLPIVLSQTVFAKKEESLIKITKDLDVHKKINPGQNYMELSVDAKHKEGKQLNYQWFTASDKTRNLSDSVQPLVDLYTGNQPTLKIIDDLENSINNWFFCAIYDESHNYTFSNPTKLIRGNIEYQEVKTSNLSIERLVKNKPIWSKDFWDNPIYFNEDGSLINDGENSILFSKIAYIIGETKTIKNIYKKEINGAKVVQLQLKENFEWTKTIYMNNVERKQPFYVYDQSLYLLEPNYNDSEIVFFNQDVFGNYLKTNQIKSTNLNDNIDELKRILVDSNCGFKNEDQIETATLTVNESNYTYSLSVQLSDNVYSSNLVKEINYSNLNYEFEDDNKIDITKISVTNILNRIMSVNYITMEEVENLRGNTIEFSSSNKEKWKWFAKTIGIPEEKFNYAKMKVIYGATNTQEFQNIPGIDWAFPLRIEVYLKSTIEFVEREPYTFKYYRDNSWTNVKVSYDEGIQENSNWRYPKIVIESNLINMRPILENNDSEKIATSYGENNFILNKYFMKTMMYFIEFGNTFEFDKHYNLNAGSSQVIDDKWTNQTLSQNKEDSNFAKYLLYSSNPKVKSILDKWHEDEIIPKDFAEYIEIKFYETEETQYKQGSYADIIFHASPLYLVFDFEPKLYNNIKMELIRENGRNNIKLSNIYCPNIDIVE